MHGSHLCAPQKWKMIACALTSFLGAVTEPHELGVNLPPFWQLQGSTRIVRIACLEKTWRRDEQQDTENDANLLQISMSIMNNYT